MTSADAVVTVAAPFRYAGGQRFVLGKTADAEQHLFVVAGDDREVSELLWVQFEQYLPKVRGAYDYSDDATVAHHGVTLFTNARRYTERPQRGSDRARAFELLERGGYRTDKLSSRARLVYLPTPRSEVMVIYAVASDEKPEALIQRALKKVAITHK